ncbi:Rrp15p-domain-containing protein [Macroventuria anomochaeta]|uniref:Rrp15p-domain-containing protein n=1 Tax=Macroventuria anomochaeta TaxID=301207 RepID=A0ACB6S7Z4_9PLEO|nr:Rrp15p-domain-containing protein [Macroventuria anomochaeta]KAF2629257.1 Rrp15p-domain-containing protein [Macroventuria anomochaeta]
MVNTSLKRRRTEAEMRKGAPKKEKKKVKRQKYYHSSDDESGDENVATDAPKNYKAPREQEAEEPFEPSGANAVERKPKPLKSALKPPPKHKMTVPAKVAAADPAHDSSPSEDELADDDDEEEEEEEEGEEEEGEEEESDLEAEADEFDIEDSDSDVSETSTAAARKVKKRNDPDAFATSISRILNTKLASTKRSEPILARSKDAQTANKELADSKLNEKARRQILAEKRAAREKGRVKDVLGLNDASTSTAEVTAKEKELRRTAQKGVIKLFNAVRAAQVKGELAEQQAKDQSMVGMAKREEKVKEMSKQGFLDMITGGQKAKEGSVEA